MQHTFGSANGTFGSRYTTFGEPDLPTVDPKTLPAGEVSVDFSETAPDIDTKD